MTAPIVAHLGHPLPLAALAGGAALIAAVTMRATSRAATAARSEEQSRPPVALLIAVVAVAVQAAHAVEHVLQAGHWGLNIGEKPWLTPWAAAGRDALVGASGSTSVATEVLHLLGNGAFLGGLLAASVAGLTSRRLGQSAIVQAAHVAEHVVLVATVAAFGRPWGVTTLFGLIDPTSPGASAFRIWLHLTVNVLATALAVAALAELPSWRRARRRTSVEVAAAG